MCRIDRVGAMAIVAHAPQATQNLLKLRLKMGGLQGLPWGDSLGKGDCGRRGASTLPMEDSKRLSTDKEVCRGNISAWIRLKKGGDGIRHKSYIMPQMLP